MANTRAQAGGQQGKNGEWYDGGQFLPRSATTEKGAFGSSEKKQAKPRKQEIAPYKWEVSEKKSIWRTVSGVCKFHRTGYSKETGAQGKLEWFDGFNWQAAGWTIEAVEETKELIERWNNGERWI